MSSEFTCCQSASYELPCPSLSNERGTIREKERPKNTRNGRLTLGSPLVRAVCVSVNPKYTDLYEPSSSLTAKLCNRAGGLGMFSSSSLRQRILSVRPEFVQLSKAYCFSDECFQIALEYSSFCGHPRRKKNSR